MKLNPDLSVDSPVILQLPGFLVLNDLPPRSSSSDSALWSLKWRSARENWCAALTPLSFRIALSKFGIHDCITLFGPWRLYRRPPVRKKSSSFGWGREKAIDEMPLSWHWHLARGKCPWEENGPKRTAYRPTCHLSQPAENIQLSLQLPGPREELPLKLPIIVASLVGEFAAMRRTHWRSLLCRIFWLLELSDAAVATEQPVDELH